MNYFIISDLAGHFDAFMRLIKRAPQDCKIIVLGDVNDKGPESRKIIEYLIAHPEITWIMGNHEHMFFKVYENITNGLKIKYEPLFWLFSNGGYFTLQSYGMNIPLPKLNHEVVSYKTIKQNLKKRSSKEVFAELMSDETTQKILDFIKTIPLEHINHIKSLPLKFETNTLFCSHAAVKAAPAFERYFDLKYIESNGHYENHGALWNRSIPTKPRKDGKFVVYGHMNVNSIYCHTRLNPNGRKADHILPDTFAVCFDTCSELYKISALLYPEMTIYQEETYEEKEK